ncbi:MAG: type VI secretion system tube protein Hcp, partial [Usitatibacteraceae bacterium]
TDDKHKGASDVVSWTFSETGNGAGKRGCIDGIEVVKFFDSASPKLITNAATGATAARDTEAQEAR